MPLTAFAGDAFAGAAVLAALLQPAITSRVSALREAATAIRQRVIDTTGLRIEGEKRLMMPPRLDRMNRPNAAQVTKSERHSRPGGYDQNSSCAYWSVA